MLFLSASVGVGHTSAAEAVAMSLGEHRIDSQIIDAYEYAVAFFSRVAADGYIRMVKTVPSLYGFLYDRAERAKKPGSLRNWLGTFSARNLHELIETMRPSCVVCTHAFPCGIMAQYKRTIDPSLPVVGVVTDYVVHPFWMYRNVDAYAVATPEMRDALLAYGIDPSRVHVTGIPVDPRFALIRSQAQARRELGIEFEGRRIALVMAGGLGIGPLEVMVRGLLPLRNSIAAVVLTGKNPRRRTRLERWCRQWEFPVMIRGFEENVFDYMHASDVLLTKPGGLSVSEALVARLPMVLVKPLGGQEQRNTRYFLERRAALHASTVDEVTQAVQRILHWPHERSRQLANAEPLRSPEAAADTAQLIRRLVVREPLRVSAVGSRPG